jgi:hypothetical protein
MNGAPIFVVVPRRAVAVLRDAHLSRDETAAKMGHPALGDHDDFADGVTAGESFEGAGEVGEGK